MYHYGIKRAITLFNKNQDMFFHFLKKMKCSKLFTDTIKIISKLT